MGIAKVVGKIVAAPIRIIDLPFRVMREIVDDPEPDRGALADTAKAVEKAVESIVKG